MKNKENMNEMHCWDLHVRYVGAIWFLVMFSNLYHLDIHNKTYVALSNIRRNICKNWFENKTSPNIVMVTGSACLLTSKLDT